MTVFVLASLPFLLGAAVLFAMSNRASGWDAMNLGIYAGVALLGWAALVIGFLIWLVIRDGLVASNILPLAILGSLVCAALWWGGSWWLQENACSRDAAFYDAIAAAPLEQRAAMVEDARNNPAEITRCGRDSLVYHFGRDLFDSLAVGSTAEHERLATWALLLEHGLP
ncbi:MAG: hypothetical protein HOI34_07200, partial [Rhodospirillaceae bacterium]|nr:hypothetical protein [Rhodospirillaceae bacterium]